MRTLVKALIVMMSLIMAAMVTSCDNPANGNGNGGGNQTTLSWPAEFLWVWNNNPGHGNSNTWDTPATGFVQPLGVRISPLNTPPSALGNFGLLELVSVQGREIRVRIARVDNNTPDIRVGQEFILCTDFQTVFEGSDGWTIRLIGGNIPSHVLGETLFVPERLRYPQHPQGPREPLFPVN